MAAAVRQTFEFLTRANTGALNDIREDIEDTARAVDDLGNEADDTSKQSGKAEKGLGALGKAAKIAFAALAAFVTLNLAKDVLKGVYDSVTEVSGAMNTFEAQTGLTGAALEEYHDVAQEIFQAGWGESFTQVAETMATVRNITQASGDELELLTQNALVMQRVFGKDITESVGTANTLMETFGVKGQTAFDLITLGLQETGDPSGDLLETMNEFAPIFADMGYSATDMLSIIKSGMKGGARNTAVLGEAIGEFNSKLQDGEAEAAIYALGLGEMNYQFRRGKVDGEDMLTSVLQGLSLVEDPLERNQLGVQLFGEKWNEVGEKALLSMTQTGVGLDELVGATERSGEAVQRGPQAAWERFTRMIQMSVADTFGPFIEQGLKRATTALEDMGQWIETKGVPVIQDFVDVIRDSSALQTVADAAGDLVGFVGDLSPESVVLLAIALGIMAGPAIVTGIAALATSAGALALSLGAAALAAAPLLIGFGLIAAYETNFGDLRDRINDFADAVKDKDLIGALEAIGGALLAIPKGIAEWVGKQVGIDVPAGLAAWGDIITLIRDNLNKIPGLIDELEKKTGIDFELPGFLKFYKILDDISSKIQAVIQGYEYLAGVASGGGSGGGAAGFGGSYDESLYPEVHTGPGLPPPPGANSGDFIGHDYVGSYQAGRPYVVGKGAQPELWIPRESGMAFPAGSYPTMGGGGTQYNFNGINLYGVNDPVRLLDKLEKEAKRRNRTLTTKGRNT